MLRNFFRRFISLETREYCIIARYRTGDWMKRFDLEAGSPYEACRIFDQSDEYRNWTRVSGACLTEAE